MSALAGWVSPAWAIEALVASSVLMLVVLLIRRPVRRAFGADVAYALWLLPVLRLMLPPLPARVHDAVVAPVLRAGEQVTVLFAEPVGAPATVAAAAPPGHAWLLPAIAMLWIVGAGVFFVWHMLAHRRFCRRLLADAGPRGEHRGIRVIETDAASGPLAFGIWRRYVAFPRDFAERYEPEERDLALAHELGHHARGDLIANWVALFVLALHWFDPIAWRAFRAFRADQEIANDARVLAGLSPMRRHTYACAILKAAHPSFLGAAVSATCHLHTIDDLKGRLKMLTTDKTSRTRRMTGAGAVTLLAAVGLGLTASGTATAARVRSTMEDATGVTLASLDQAAPLPPVPPVPSVATPSTVPPAPPAPPETKTDTASAAPAKHKVARVVTIDSVQTTEGERPAANDVKSWTKRRMVITMPGDPNHRVEFQDLPAISEGKCGIVANKPAMILYDDKDGEKRKMVFCTDRIEKAAADGAAVAANSKDIERNAYARALDGLRASRARMMQDLSGEQRKAALDGIDTAIAELEGDLAKAR